VFIFKGINEPFGVIDVTFIFKGINELSASWRIGFYFLLFNFYFLISLLQQNYKIYVAN